MNEYLSFGRIILDVSKKVLAGNEEEALQKICQLINELNADISNITITTLDGKVHNLDVNNFCIKWEEALE
ncbi:hypothetical protein ABEV38_18280 [Parageobacillus thermoglucosidasius]|uniref:hypothetical protein n=1 Tax=Parageobacillus thermoglucosidasius TaxID=1426 RepID=UPI003D2A3FAE